VKDTSGNTPRKGAKDSLRVVASPLLAYFDRRFQDVYDRLDERLDRLYERVATEVETISEMTLGMQRFVDVSGQQIDDLIAQIDRLRDDLQRLASEVRAGA
jgi:hypothetical protein